MEILPNSAGQFAVAITSTFIYPSANANQKMMMPVTGYFVSFYRMYRNLEILNSVAKPGQILWFSWKFCDLQKTVGPICYVQLS